MLRRRSASTGGIASCTGAASLPIPTARRESYRSAIIVTAHAPRRRLCRRRTLSTSTPAASQSSRSKSRFSKSFVSEQQTVGSILVERSFSYEVRRYQYGYRRAHSSGSADLWRSPCEATRRRGRFGDVEV